MQHGEHLLSGLLFFASFLVVTSVLKEVTKRLKFPYTVGLLLVGFLTQFGVNLLGIDAHLVLSTDIIFFILLPILLFEAALHINFHQFRLQFKTLTFFATFGYLLSVFIIGIGIALVLKLPFGAALLFGTLISATDPIAVLALFKSLGAPKRLSLIADGESMFNDAVAVIVFRLVSGLVVADQLVEPVHFLGGVGRFVFVFSGSIFFGIALGYVASYALEKIKKDPLVETTITLVLAFGSFILGEHYFGLSGVISTVMAGLVLGNIGKTKISEGVMPFIQEIWEYLSFLALSIVFFFAAFNLRWSIFEGNITILLMGIVVVLFARTISVYTTFTITNRLGFFGNEPDVPKNWQHIINWGGLRGVIPLVLVFSLPETYEFFDEILALTFSTLLFSLIVNGLTIEWLLRRLKLHIPQREEAIIKEESYLFDLEEAISILNSLKQDEEFDNNIINSYREKLHDEELQHKQRLLELADPQEFERSLYLEAIMIERKRIEELFKQGHIPESVYFDFEAQLDLQQDALEYPNVYKGRGYTSGGHIEDRLSFRLKLNDLKKMMSARPTLTRLLKIDQKSTISNRHAMLRARITSSQQVFEFLNKVESMLEDESLINVVHKVRKTYEDFKQSNLQEIDQIKSEFPSIIKNYQEKIISSIINRQLGGSY